MPPSLQGASQHTISRKSSKTFINIIHGDCLEKLKEIESLSIHLVVADPPYFLDGLDAGWEKGKSEAEAEARRTAVMNSLLFEEKRRRF